MFARSVPALTDWRHAWFVTGRLAAFAGLVLTCTVVWSGFAVPGAAAHPAYFTAAMVTVEPDGCFRLSMQFDTLAFALNDTSARIGNPAMEALLDGPREELAARLTGAKGRFLQGFSVTTDRGAAVVESVDFPDAAAVLAWRATASPVFPVVVPVRVQGRLPAGATDVAFRFPVVLAQVILTVERPGEEPYTEPVEAGTASTALPVRIERGPAMSAPATPPASPPLPRAAPSRWGMIGRYVVMGFRHILPDGLDHILFVLGLFLLSARLRPLLVQITAFTVAHSITLGLSLYGVVRLPASVVEPLIALSIVIVAVENLRTTRLNASRTLVVFFFGLMHGLGFATALTDLGLPRQDFFTALIGFNAGVELGQLSVVAIAAGTIGLLRHWPRYRQAVVYPLSGAIAIIALFWTVQRVFLAVRS